MLGANLRLTRGEVSGRSRELQKLEIYWIQWRTAMRRWGKGRKGAGEEESGRGADKYSANVWICYHLKLAFQPLSWIPDELTKFKQSAFRPLRPLAVVDTPLAPTVITSNLPNQRDLPYNSC